MADCVFCAIASGELPAEIVHSDDRVVAFRDLHPQAALHVLVIPRLHRANAAELAAADPALVGELVAAAHAVATADGRAESGYRLVFNTGADAGQTVFHAHLHLLAGGPLGLTLG
jgi:histidine triad (HIT) family protein